MEHKVYTTNKHCPFCRNSIVRLEPAWQGWEYWCPWCNRLVIPLEDLEELRKETKKEKGLIGYVIGIPAPFTVDQAAIIRQRLEGE